jgi:hypothetical protein
MITTIARMKIVITEMWVLMALAALGTALTNNLCNLMITTPLILITLIPIIMILIDIMRAPIREEEANPIARDMDIEMIKFIP